ncbi:hypothetical protein Vadar_000222 [Vaccinium darrowii]|uniref:Uncharacterized protein n=1 Tax=Vaccinium darrowii TaxID=229202 RepID=A0ACB7YHS6_9ERIC|nr:hypothetical protein Vadar_000222 [Vaccinium darrowii]
MFNRSLAGEGTKRSKPLLLLLLLLFPVTCLGNKNQQFINSCGDIHDISLPFHLQGDPSYTCVESADNYFTLSCDENNRTVLHLFSGKYYVQSINYTGNTIRLVDEGIQTNDICSSFPLSSLNPFEFFLGDSPYFSYAWFSTVVFLNCENPVQYPLYTNRTANCNTDGYYSYVLAGEPMVRDVADSCTVEVLYMSTSQLIMESGSNLSWLDFNRELGYGFEVSWVFGCDECTEMASCFGDSVNVTAVCSQYCSCQYCPFQLPMPVIGE